MDIPEKIQGFCEYFLVGLKAALSEKLVGVYLYGGWAFPEGNVKGDIDFHVILKSPLNAKEKSALREFHASIGVKFPLLAGEGLDGYYLLLAETRQRMSPRHQLLDGVVDDSWALHCAHIRAGRCMILYGPDPKEIYPAPSWIQLEGALLGEIQYVKKHLADYPAYAVLNLCRLMYSFKTRDVVISKHAAAQWARNAFPGKSAYIDTARKAYERCGTGSEKELLISRVMSFFDFATRFIREYCKNEQAA
jgi:hypothetical protein